MVILFFTLFMCKWMITHFCQSLSQRELQNTSYHIVDLFFSCVRFCSRKSTYWNKHLTPTRKHPVAPKICINARFVRCLKRHDVFLNALSHLQNRRPEALSLLLGEQVYCKVLERRRWARTAMQNHIWPWNCRQALHTIKVARPRSFTILFLFLSIYSINSQEKLPRDLLYCKAKTLQ